MLANSGVPRSAGSDADIPSFVPQRAATGFAVCDRADVVTDVPATVDHGARGARRSSRGRTALQRGWLPMVTVLALTAGALGVWKVHQSSQPGPVPKVPSAQAPEQFTPKQLTYELFGAAGEGGILSYVDINGHPPGSTSPNCPGRTPRPPRSPSCPAASRRKSTAARSAVACWSTALSSTSNRRGVARTPT
jgi:hypothetical protein